MEVFVVQVRVTSSPSITGWTGLCRITAPPQHTDKLQRFIHLHSCQSDQQLLIHFKNWDRSFVEGWAAHWVILQTLNHFLVSVPIYTLHVNQKCAADSSWFVCDSSHVMSHTYALWISILCVKKCPRTGRRRESVHAMLWILPMVMLMVLLQSLCLDSHQYTPLSDCLVVSMRQAEGCWSPQPSPHWEKTWSELGNIDTW